MRKELLQNAKPILFNTEVVQAIQDVINKWITLWNSTSKDGYKWDINPYVFVYEFEQVKDNK